MKETSRAQSLEDAFFVLKDVSCIFEQPADRGILFVLKENPICKRNHSMLNVPEKGFDTVVQKVCGTEGCTPSNPNKNEKAELQKSKASRQMLNWPSPWSRPLLKTEMEFHPSAEGKASPASPQLEPVSTSKEGEGRDESLPLSPSLLKQAPLILRAEDPDPSVPEPQFPTLRAGVMSSW
jgi:hypothetical protein